jgi:hypothetical protein
VILEDIDLDSAILCQELIARPRCGEAGVTKDLFVMGYYAIFIN